MPNLPSDELKRYYSIGEVAELFQVSKSLIRFWENEFEFLKPHKNSKGDRRFTPENLEQLSLIYELVKEKGFTLEGAKKEIKRRKSFQRDKAKVLAKLNGIKKFLEKVREELPE